MTSNLRNSGTYFDAISKDAHFLTDCMENIGTSYVNEPVSVSYPNARNGSNKIKIQSFCLAPDGAMEMYYQEFDTLDIPAITWTFGVAGTYVLRDRFCDSNGNWLGWNDFYTITLVDRPVDSSGVPQANGTDSSQLPAGGTDTNLPSANETNASYESSESESKSSKSTDKASSSSDCEDSSSGLEKRINVRNIGRQLGDLFKEYDCNKQNEGLQKKFLAYVVSTITYARQTKIQIDEHHSYEDIAGGQDAWKTFIGSLSSMIVTESLNEIFASDQQGSFSPQRRDIEGMLGRPLYQGNEYVAITSQELRNALDK